MLWAAIVALLRDRFNANEILVSLMLVYVADLLLTWLVFGPWKDPMGYNFPQTVTFSRGHPDSTVRQGLRGVHWALLFALVVVAAVWVFLFAHLARLSSCRWADWRRRRRAMPASRRGARCGPACCCRAAFAGLAGALRGGRPDGPAHAACAGRATDSRPSSSPSSGRLHPLGCIVRLDPAQHVPTSAANWRSRASDCLPRVATGVFQGVLLFSLLGLRHPDPIPRSCAGVAAMNDDCAAASRRCWPAGTPLAIAGLGLLINETAGVRQPGRRGHDAGVPPSPASPPACPRRQRLGWASRPERWPARWLAALFGCAGDLAQHQPVRHRPGAQPVRRRASRPSSASATCGEKLAERVASACPVSCDMPFFGPALFRQHPMVYAGDRARRRR
jgi:hypothetical protein